MRIIYSCYFGSYLAVVAASLHLGLIKGFDPNSFLELPYFGKLPESELGRIYYVGKDNLGREIYVMGSRKVGEVIERALKGIASIYNMGEESLIFINLLPYGNAFYSIGCFLIHRLNLKTLGTLFLMMGIKKSFEKIKRLVDKVKKSP
ncbi:MAG: DUF3189 family protein [Thermosediminibacteraceae bacterium]|nr:DUF3189 family protein [Thermosediminibacteraceae bacterium]